MENRPQIADLDSPDLAGPVHDLVRPQMLDRHVRSPVRSVPSHPWNENLNRQVTATAPTLSLVGSVGLPRRIALHLAGMQCSSPESWARFVTYPDFSYVERPCFEHDDMGNTD